MLPHIFYAADLIDLIERDHGKLRYPFGGRHKRVQKMLKTLQGDVLYKTLSTSRSTTLKYLPYLHFGGGEFRDIYFFLGQDGNLVKQVLHENADFVEIYWNFQAGYKWPEVYSLPGLHEFLMELPQDIGSQLTQDDKNFHIQYRRDFLRTCIDCLRQITAKSDNLDWLKRDWLFYSTHFSQLNFHLVNFFSEEYYQDAYACEMTEDLIVVLWDVDWKATVHLPDPVLPDKVIDWLNKHKMTIATQQSVFTSVTNLIAHIYRSVMAEVYVEPIGIKQLYALRDMVGLVVDEGKAALFTL
ncbi:hypothetical protein GALMADRAFT_147946 [Galerina marginata CBS 339.88]|uniref:Uncharacterized protein n=1 Tax=Galerina marginata (strain CBS 339.88) TaxID=685588 RepID=A0A067S8V3_GALM3|nr:hypothetical protein GALMADRAFT_147946 [Galerina marginata CBS 339.88]